MAPRSFRTATPGDYPQLIALINRAFIVERTFKAGGDRIDTPEFEDLAGRGAFLIAEVDGVAQGCMFYELRGDYGYLGLLAVEPESQGQGIGSALMTAGEALLREAGCLAAEILVLSLRPELLPLYRRAGYRELGREPVHVESITLPSEFVRMRKSLA